MSTEEVVQYVGLLDKLNVKIEKLSFSEKRRLHIGRVMIHNPDLDYFGRARAKCRYREYDYYSKSDYENERARKGDFYYIILSIGRPFVNRRCIHIKQ